MSEADGNKRNGAEGKHNLMSEANGNKRTGAEGEHNLKSELKQAGKKTDNKNK